MTNAASSVPNASSPGDDQWWRTFFDAEYARFGLESTDQATLQRMVDFIIASLELTPGCAVFDQCCGVGRISIPLARRGMRIVGVDITAEYIQRAAARAAAEGLSCEFLVGDAFSFITAQPCDAAINWYSSFGYGLDDKANLAMLRCVFQSLRPGGLFLLDQPNWIWRVSNATQGRVWRPAIEGKNSFIIAEEAEFDWRAGVANTTWTLMREDGSRGERRFAMRMYMPHELCRMLADAGFQVRSLAGGVDCQPLRAHSPRCLVVAQRPA